MCFSDLFFGETYERTIYDRLEKFKNEITPRSVLEYGLSWEISGIKKTIKELLEYWRRDGGAVESDCL